jgi:hypothetical protein
MLKKLMGRHDLMFGTTEMGTACSSMKYKGTYGTSQQYFILALFACLRRSVAHSKCIVAWRTAEACPRKLSAAMGCAAGMEKHLESEATEAWQMMP